MKKRNKFLALFLAAALSVSVTACGSADAGNSDDNSPSSTVQDEKQDATMSIPKMLLSMTCSDYNAAEEFSIPDEAKAGTPAAE